jgi:glycosyltransferase involved in cell wall biosynthesis
VPRADSGGSGDAQERAQSRGVVRIFSNAPWFEGRLLAGRPVRAVRPSGDGFWDVLRDYRQVRHFDLAVFNISSRALFWFCVLRKLDRAARVKVVSVDLIVGRPRSLAQRLRVSVARWALGAVERFLLYFRDIHALCQVYGIEAQRVRYIPFKVNDWESVTRAVVTDDQYILACGRSKRDYATFCRAVEALPYRATILAPIGDAREHGTNFDFMRVPPNVTVVSDDGSPGSWLDWLRRCTLLVLPVLPDTLAPSGIGTYLMAMALGKCVIITDSPATRGLLTGEMAVLVPPADPQALRDAIRRVMEDQALRASVAAAGRAYARSLGDERRLADDIVMNVGELLSAGDAGAAAHSRVGRG